jgi:hypothetical protein
MILKDSGRERMNRVAAASAVTCTRAFRPDGQRQACGHLDGMSPGDDSTCISKRKDRRAVPANS